jgi:hypothetical protein
MGKCSKRPEAREPKNSMFARANELLVVNHCQWGSIFRIRKEFAEG